ncbi:hypothetical protein [Legionella gresilensis]|uniref:hypothetical protein n=1 Tax=Legionella gresilensis TaxID=91823 RepID=UPI0010412FF1|nr:hypothetical protein [Legionella gresilensis]
MLLKNKRFISAIAFGIPFSIFSVHAGTMGPIQAIENKFLLIEGGASYLHAFYKDSARGANSFTRNDFGGRRYNPSRVYPNDFFGGYMGVSFLLDTYMMNVRYELFESKTKNFNHGSLLTTLAPTKLAFTLDKMWGTYTNLSVGVGAGVIASTHNKAEIYDYQLAPYQNEIGISFPGRVRLDPLVEAVAMYKLFDNFNLKANVSYQIPVHSFYTNGHLDVNLGINYAIPL